MNQYSEATLEEDPIAIAVSNLGKRISSESRVGEKDEMSTLVNGRKISWLVVPGF